MKAILKDFPRTDPSSVVDNVRLVLQRYVSGHLHNATLPGSIPIALYFSIVVFVWLTRDMAFRV